MKRRPRIEVVCKNCAKTFTAPLCRLEIGKKKYCSHACYFHRHSVVTREDKVCEKCGKTWSHLISQGTGRFCSVICYKTQRQVPNKTCEICKSIFRPKNVEKANRFCGFKCYWQSLRLDPEEKRLRANARVRRYRKERKGWAAECKQRRRAREVDAPGHFTAGEWLELQEKQKNLCAGCFLPKKLTVDHIVPLSKGGSNYIGNIQGLCLSCNSRKWVKI